jgi:tRNA 2-thiocytidine biosynthesis protein TtcA
VRVTKQEGRSRLNEALALIKRTKERYGFLEKHTRVIVGVSGGIDSTLLLLLLHEYNERFTQGWSIHACHVIMDIPGYRCPGVKGLLKFLNAEYTIAKTHIPGSTLKKHSACYVCSRYRRQKLLEVAESMNIQQIALAHHKQDVAETLILNMMYNGEISTLIPKQSVIQGRHFFIRPLYAFDKKAIEVLAGLYNLPASRASCPYFKDSKRNSVRTFLAQCEKENPDVSKNIFRAVSHLKRTYLP